MFSFGETTPQEDQIVDVHETSGVLIVLLRLLHYPLHPPVLLGSDAEDTEMSSRRPQKIYDPSTVIPLPILFSILLELVDKYALSNSIAETLHAHLLVYVPTHPLQIYGYAAAHGLEKLASRASQYLMPIASYSSQEIMKEIPSIAPYHRIVQLQDLRVKELRILVLGEDIFPHGGFRSHPVYSTHIQISWNYHRVRDMRFS